MKGIRVKAKGRSCGRQAGQGGRDLLELRVEGGRDALRVRALLLRDQGSGASERELLGQGRLAEHEEAMKEVVCRPFRASEGMGSCQAQGIRCQFEAVRQREAG